MVLPIKIRQNQGLCAECRQQVYVYDSPTQVRILTGRDTLIGDKLLPDFHLPLARLFQRSASTQVVPGS
jgi:hypothetical protein